ncbi:hypothetical protein B0H11DRAFT_1928126 [Mycena galericulata]|nr:hypothetical protein B0H11DRAFT_1928126 [Mycena galericulata]
METTQGDLSSPFTLLVARIGHKRVLETLIRMRRVHFAATIKSRDHIVITSFTLIAHAGIICRTNHPPGLLKRECTNRILMLTVTARSPFASPTLKEPRQINIDGEFVTTSIIGRRVILIPSHRASTRQPSFAAIPHPKTFVFHDISVPAHPIICGGCENTIVGVGCGSHVPTPNTHSGLDDFLQKVMNTDLSAHRAIFLAQGFNMEMICIVSRGTEDV